MQIRYRVPYQRLGTSIGLLAVRLVIGMAFMHHGWGKIQHPFDWMGPHSGTPGVHQALAALSEFGGGFAFITGLIVPLASAGLLATMGYALHFHLLIKGDPFIGKGSSYELALVFFSVAILMLAAGPGKISADYLIFGEKSS